MNLVFEPLTKINLDEAINLVGKVFPDYLEHVRKIYSLSLSPDRSDEYWKTRNILEYWVVKDDASKKIVALTGFYQLTKHSPDEIWCGWFCVDPAQRGKGIGRKTIEWTIEQARKREYAYLRLWTSTDPDEAIAQKLYDSVGLTIYSQKYDEKTGDTILYRELKLR